MKRFMLAALLALVMATPCYAWVNSGTFDSKSISTTMYNGNATLANCTNSSGFLAGPYRQLAFFVNYTESAAAVNVLIAPQAAYEDQNGSYYNITFYDFAGGATNQTVENITSNQTYIFWLNPDVVYPYVRINSIAQAANLTDLANVTIYVSGRK